MDHKIKKANAVYTGGNIWLFFGELHKGYFLTDDNGDTIILDKSAENLDESLYTEWLDKHKIKDLEGTERKEFQTLLLERLRTPAECDDMGGFTSEDADRYERYWEENDEYWEHEQWLRSRQKKESMNNDNI